MSSVEPDPQVAQPGDTETAAETATPPQAKLMVFVFPDEAKVDQAIGAIVTKLSAKEDMSVFRVAVVARGPDGRIAVKDLTGQELGTIGAGAFIGGLAGLAAGPVGAAIGAGAGALFGWSAELVNEQAVSEFANKDLQQLALGRRAIIAELGEEATAAFVALMAANGGTVSGGTGSG